MICEKRIKVLMGTKDELLRHFTKKTEHSRKLVIPNAVSKKFLTKDGFKKQLDNIESHFGVIFYMQYVDKKKSTKKTTKKTVKVDIKELQLIKEYIQILDKKMKNVKELE